MGRQNNPCRLGVPVVGRIQYGWITLPLRDPQENGGINMSTNMIGFFPCINPVRRRFFLQYATARWANTAAVWIFVSGEKRIDVANIREQLHLRDLPHPPPSDGGWKKGPRP